MFSTKISDLIKILDKKNILALCMPKLFNILIIKQDVIYFFGNKEKAYAYMQKNYDSIYVLFIM